MSTSVIWLLVIAYEVIAVLAARMAYPYLLEDAGTDEAIERFLAAFMALMGGNFWPLVAPIALVLWRPRKTPEQLQAENEQMKRHIADMERELGIGGRR